MERSRLLGLDKLFDRETGRFRWGKQSLDAAGHAAIAFGASLLLVPVALWRRWRLVLCMAVGAGVGTGALLGREGIQLALSGSPHLYDRLLDTAPGPLFGALGGLACYYAASRLLRWWRSR